MYALYVYRYAYRINSIFVIVIHKTTLSPLQAKMVALIKVPI